VAQKKAKWKFSFLYLIFVHLVSQRRNWHKEDSVDHKFVTERSNYNQQWGQGQSTLTFFNQPVSASAVPSLALDFALLLRVLQILAGRLGRTTVLQLNLRNQLIERAAYSAEPDALLKHFQIQGVNVFLQMSKTTVEVTKLGAQPASFNFAGLLRGF
jgi:hypothetical protein